MLVWVGALVACVLCVICAVIFMRGRGGGGSPELKAKRAAVATVVRGKTVDQAIAQLRLTHPDVRAVMISPDQEYVGPQTGFVVVFHADSGAENVTSFDIGQNGFWIDQNL